MNETEYEKSKSLWLECFEEDDADFVDFYYSARSKPEFTLGAFLTGSELPIAMLHMIPTEMRFSGERKRIAEIAGVCTKPEYRRRGVCALLFDSAFRILRDKNYDAAALCPFRVSFYERLGFSEYITRQRVELLSKYRTSAAKRYPPIARRMAEIYNEFMSRFDGCTLRDEAYFENAIREYSMKGAQIVFTGDGVCCGYEEDGGATFAASELFFTDGTDPSALLPDGYSKYVFPLPLDCIAPQNAVSRNEGFAMIKPVKDDFSYDPARCYGFDRY